MHGNKIYPIKSNIFEKHLIKQTRFIFVPAGQQIIIIHDLILGNFNVNFITIKIKEKKTLYSTKYTHVYLYSYKLVPICKYIQKIHKS